MEFLIGLLVAGVAGWALAGLLPQPWRAGRIGFAVLAALIGASLLPRAMPAPSLEQQLLRSPTTRDLAQAWRQSDPEGFTAFVDEAYEANQDRDIGAMIELLIPRLNAALTERLLYLSNADVVAIEQNLRDVLLQFAVRNPRLCPAVGAGVSPNLSNAEAREIQDAMGALGRQRMALFVAAFRADTSAPVDAMVGEELEAALEGVRIRTAAAVGEEDMALLQGGDAAVGREARYCEVLAEFEQQLSSAPEPGRLYRGIILSQRTP